MEVPRKINPNFHGKKGRSGRQIGWRKSKETQDLLNDIFFKRLKKERVLQRIASGRYSIKDKMVEKAYAGETSILLKIFDKVFPDSVKVKGSGLVGVHSPEEVEEAIKNLKRIKKNLEIKDDAIKV